MTLAIHNEARFSEKPRAVLFDTDNTLYAYDPAHEAGMKAVVDKAKQVLGIDADDFLEAFSKARDIIKKRLKGTASCHSRLLYMQQTLELLGLKTQLYLSLDFEQTYWRTFLSNAELFPGVCEFLASLRRAGIATAVITDLTTQIQFRKLIYFGLKDAFDFVVTSEEAGADKPDAAPFELALKKLGVKPESAFMIGDSTAADIMGARRAGIPSAQKRHAGVEVGTDDRKADLIFDTFPELERQFDKCGWLAPTAKKATVKKA